MVFVNTGTSGAALSIGSLASNRPQYMAIGNGSEALSATRVGLVEESDRRIITSANISIANEILYTGNWDSIDMSGLGLTESALFTQSGANTGSAWSVEGFAAVTFDGTNELQIQVTYEVYNS